MMQIPTSNLKDVAFSVAFHHPSTIQPGCTHIRQREVICRSMNLSPLDVICHLSIIDIIIIIVYIYISIYLFIYTRYIYIIS